MLADDKTRLPRPSDGSEVGAVMAARPDVREKSRLHPGIKPQLMIALLNSQLWDVYRGGAAALFCLRWRERLEIDKDLWGRSKSQSRKRQLRVR